ncbi:hypothetical protein B5V02_22365 [Mesorhizobium kowhaii]|uniref:Uncharacterized protein n=1 Tax=Mesorhizobium kowhaii TaxID=1300272 RepID=A0A2W7C116_9HYPH|nr:hypothetical protein B5V02_22365 [Mesorhizobium kowhaii]
MDVARISTEAWRQADSVAPPPRYDPFRAGVTGAAIAGGVVAVFGWLGGSSHMTGEIGVIVILAFALPYVHLRSEDRKNQEAFEKEYIRLLELEREREERLPTGKPKSLPARKARLTVRRPRLPVRKPRPGFQASRQQIACRRYVGWRS